MKEKHVLVRMTSILNNLDNASLEDVSQLLEYYNGKPVLIDGVTYHPYNDPRVAARINARYNELTGKDHPTFIAEQKDKSKVIEGENKFIEDLQALAYTKEEIEQINVEETDAPERKLPQSGDIEPI